MRNRLAAEYVLLGLLMTDAMHGYDIVKALRERLGEIWRVGTSQVYLLLQRLEKKGLVASRRESAGSRPVKKTFRITTAGRNAFIAWVQAPTPHLRDLRIEFMTKVFFWGFLGLPDGLDLVQKQIHVLEKLRGKVKKRRSEQAEGYRKLVLGFRHTQFDAAIDWLNSEAKPYMQAVESKTGAVV